MIITMKVVVGTFFVDQEELRAFHSFLFLSITMNVLDSVKKRIY